MEDRTGNEKSQRYWVASIDASVAPVPLPPGWRHVYLWRDSHGENEEIFEKPAVALALVVEHEFERAPDGRVRRTGRQREGQWHTVEVDPEGGWLDVPSSNLRVVLGPGQGSLTLEQVREIA